MNRALRFSAWLLGAVLLLTAVAPGGAAQSLLAGHGLGVEGEPLDARAQALGGIGLGFPGGHLSMVNPASVAGLPAPALLAVFRPAWTQARYPGGETDFSTSRFPLFHAAAPLGERWVVSAGYGSVLDQNFAVQERDTTILAGSEIEARDSLVVSGGVARFRLGSAYAVTDRFALGAAVDLYTGSRRESDVRRFAWLDTAAAVTPPDPSVRNSVSEYSGVGWAVGAQWSPSLALTLSSSVAGGGSLEAQPSDTVVDARSYDLPLRISGGASGRISRAATAVIGAEWAGWSAADEALTEAGGARDALSVGGGLEWDSSAQGARAFPLRLGAKYARLPFRWTASTGSFDFATERALTGGVGARLAGGAAMIDLAAERGMRGGDGAGIDESYWRASLSLTLLGR